MVINGSVSFVRRGLMQITRTLQLHASGLGLSLVYLPILAFCLGLTSSRSDADDFQSFLDTIVEAKGGSTSGSNDGIVLSACVVGCPLELSPEATVSFDIRGCRRPDVSLISLLTSSHVRAIFGN